MPTYRTSVRWDYSVGGGPGYSTFHYRTGVGADQQADLDNARDTLNGAFGLLLPLLPPTSSVSSDGFWIDIDTSEAYTTDTWSNEGSSSNVGYLPPATAICLNWLTSSRTRSGRGRTFIGPLSMSTAEGNGTPTSDAIDRVLLFGQRIVDHDPVGLDGSFGVYSPSQNIIRDLVGVQARDQFAVLRSRRD